MSPTVQAKTYHSKWPLFAGILMFLLGIYMFFNPVQTIVALAAYIGVIFILIGAAYFFASFSYQSGWYLASGCLNMIIGIVLIANLGVSVDTIPLVFGLWSVSLGIVETIASFQYQRKNMPWKSMLISGLIGIVVGVLILAYPVFSSMTIALLLGVYFAVYGIMEVVQYVRLSRN